MRHTSSPKANKPRHLWTACVTHFVYHFLRSLMSLDSSCQDFFNDIGGIIIGTSMCLQGLFIFIYFLVFSIFTNYKEKRGGEKTMKEKKKKLTLEAHWSSDDLDETSSTISKKIISGEWSGPHEPSKGVDSLAFRLFVWSTSVTVDDLSWCRWIHFIKIFSKILVVSLSKFGVSKVFFFSFFIKSCVTYNL